jgi:CheY-like chemotaxis protein
MSPRDRLNLVAAGRHVLIIEDEMLIAMEIEQDLADLGFSSADIADTPARALACATRHRPDLITADMRINEGTGLEAVQAIVAALGDVPVIYVTGNTDMLRGQSVSIVEKPIWPGSIASACKKAGLV